MVRIHPDPPVRCRVEAAVYRYLEQDRGCSSIGRAPALQAGGRRFDPDQLHQFRSQKSEVTIGCGRSSQLFAFGGKLRKAESGKLRAGTFFNNLEGKGASSLMRA